MTGQIGRQTRTLNCRDVTKRVGWGYSGKYFKEFVYSGSLQPQLPTSGGQAYFLALGMEGTSRLKES